MGGGRTRMAGSGQSHLTASLRASTRLSRNTRLVVGVTVNNRLTFEVLRRIFAGNAVNPTFTLGMFHISLQSQKQQKDGCNVVSLQLRDTLVQLGQHPQDHIRLRTLIEQFNPNLMQPSNMLGQQIGLYRGGG